VVSNLSNRYEVADIDPANDHISSAKDDEWNRKILEMFAEGRLEDVSQVAREFGREANADMGFKAVWWLAALAGEHNRYDGKVWDYQPVWGTGNAIVELTPNPHKALEFEKEFDEGPLELGTGLDTQDVIPTLSRAEEEGPVWAGGGQDDPLRATRAHRSFPFGSAQGRDDIVHTERAAAPVGPYPHARRVGDLLFLSGIGPRQAGTNAIPEGIEAQTRATIENIRNILEAAGSSLDKILDVTVYLTDMKRDFERFNRVYTELLGEVRPTRTTVGVDSLPTPISVEMKVIAGS